MNKDTFFSFKNEPVEVTIDGLGTLHIKQWTAWEREEFAKWTEKNKDKQSEIAARCFLISLVNADGSPFLSKEDTSKVASMPAATVDAVLQACLKVNAIDAGAIDEAKKN